MVTNDVTERRRRRADAQDVFDALAADYRIDPTSAVPACSAAKPSRSGPSFSRLSAATDNSSSNFAQRWPQPSSPTAIGIPMPADPGNRTMARPNRRCLPLRRVTHAQ